MLFDKETMILIAPAMAGTIAGGFSTILLYPLGIYILYIVMKSIYIHPIASIHRVLYAHHRFGEGSTSSQRGNIRHEQNGHSLHSSRGSSSRRNSRLVSGKILMYHIK